MREGGERPQGLDLVAEQLDPDGLSARRGEHVDDPTANGELAPLLDSLVPFVAGEREALDQPIDTELIAGSKADGRRPRARGRDPFGDSERRGTHQPG